MPRDGAWIFVFPHSETAGVGSPGHFFASSMPIEEMLGKAASIIVGGTEKKHGFHDESLRC
jgi:hypothetical protein